MQISQITIIIILIIAVAGLVFVSCKRGPGKRKTQYSSQVVHPEWSKNAIIYEVNIRQYTPEGTFKAFQQHLPRLKEMGVDIIWLMPIHPIGVENRKGGLGSYYSVKDYKGVNLEFGTLEDFKQLVKKAHELDMYLILDWVANHTAWDHKWASDHPEWYVKDENGELKSPFDWTDVIELDYDVEAVGTAMLDALRYWVEEADIDGYRCDVANEVPLNFWNQARLKLDKIKPVFMLAESEVPEHHVEAFDMTYAWELHHIMNKIAKGEGNARDIDNYFTKHDTIYPVEAYRMNFITNHDENSWNGTEYERMGDAVNTFAVLTYTLPGMPLIYSGQEAALKERLEFFEKDTIHWGNFALKDFYTDLADLRKSNQALWSGEYGGNYKRVKTSDNKNIFAFIRKHDDNAVLVLANLSPREISFNMKEGGKKKELTNWSDGSTFILEPGMPLTLNAWEYRVFTMIRN